MKWDQQRNIEQTKQGNTIDEIKNYQQNCFKHVNRMDNNRPPKLALQYWPRRKVDIGRPRRRWREKDHLNANQLRSAGLNSAKPTAWW